MVSSPAEPPQRDRPPIFMSARTLLIVTSASMISAIPSAGAAVIAWVPASAALPPAKAIVTAIAAGLVAFVPLVMKTVKLLHRLVE